MPPQTVSILIPTHNRADILAQTLQSLAAVKPAPGVPVELIVVANACTDNTAEVVAAAAPSLPFPVRLVAEPQPGLNIARNRAAIEARYDILAFLDDDVWVHPGWLIELLAVYRDHPAGIVGGRIELWWQAVQRPAWWLDRWDSLLSAVDLGGQTQELTACQIFGANFSITREVYQRAGPFHPDLDRKGTQLLGGGETKLALDAMAHGFRLFYAGRASVKHWVGPNRATPQYLYGVSRGGATTIVLMRQPLSARYVLRTASIAAARLVIHAPLLLAAKATGNTQRRVRHGLGVAVGRGALGGLTARLTGRGLVPLSGLPSAQPPQPSHAAPATNHQPAAP